MKLEKGTVVYAGRKKFVDEIPDKIAPKNLKAEAKKPVEKKEGKAK